MAENIVIRLFVDEDKPVEWILTDSSGARHSAPTHGSLSAAAAAAVGYRVLALLPSSDMLITTADVPAKGARLLQALPFALEEQLAEDVDKLHFAAGARRSNGLTPVVVTDRQRFEDYLARLRGVGLEPEGVYAEVQGLARIPGTISMLIDSGDLLINDGADIELDLQDMSPGDALVAIGALDDPIGDDEAAEGSNELPGHVLVYLSEEDNDRYSNDWLALRNELDSIDTRILPDGALPRLAATVSTGKAINLLQGRFRDATNRERRLETVAQRRGAVAGSACSRRHRRGHRIFLAEAPGSAPAGRRRRSVREDTAVDQTGSRQSLEPVSLGTGASRCFDG